MDSYDWRDASMEVDAMLIESTSRYSSPGGSGPVLGAFNVEGTRAIGISGGVGVGVANSSLGGGGGGTRAFSPALTVGSVGDVQSYWLSAGLADTSGYNTEYEDAVTTAGDGDGDRESQGPPDTDADVAMGTDVDVDEELARLA